MATDTEAKKRWDKENTFFIGIKFQKKTDQDVIDFLEGKNKRDTICAAIREYIENHPELKEEENKMTAHDIIANGLFNQAVNLMDDEIREELHASGDYDGNDEAFLEAYMAAHEAKFGEQFTI